MLSKSRTTTASNKKWQAGNFICKIIQSSVVPKKLTSIISMHVQMWLNAAVTFLALPRLVSTT